MGRWLTITALFGLLALVGWIGHRLWNLVDINMPTWAWAALGFGVALSLLVGCGLMALLFYSSRMGYDEPPQTPDNPSADELGTVPPKGPSLAQHPAYPCCPAALQAMLSQRVHPVA